MQIHNLSHPYLRALPSGKRPAEMGTTVCFSSSASTDAKTSFKQLKIADLPTLRQLKLADQQPRETNTDFMYRYLKAALPTLRECRDYKAYTFLLPSIVELSQYFFNKKNNAFEASPVIEALYRQQELVLLPSQQLLLGDPSLPYTGETYPETELSRACNQLAEWLVTASQQKSVSASNMPVLENNVLPCGPLLAKTFHFSESIMHQALKTLGLLEILEKQAQTSPWQLRNIEIAKQLLVQEKSQPRSQLTQNQRLWEELLEDIKSQQNHSFHLEDLRIDSKRRLLDRSVDHQLLTALTEVGVLTSVQGKRQRRFSLNPTHPLHTLDAYKEMQPAVLLLPVQKEPFSAHGIMSRVLITLFQKDSSLQEAFKALVQELNQQYQAEADRFYTHPSKTRSPQAKTGSFPTDHKITFEEFPKTKRGLLNKKPTTEQVQQLFKIFKDWISKPTVRQLNTGDIFPPLLEFADYFGLQSNYLPRLIFKALEQQGWVTFRSNGVQVTHPQHQPLRKVREMDLYTQTILKNLQALHLKPGDAIPPQIIPAELYRYRTTYFYLLMCHGIIEPVEGREPLSEGVSGFKLKNPNRIQEILARFPETTYTTQTDQLTHHLLSWISDTYEINQAVSHRSLEKIASQQFQQTPYLKPAFDILQTSGILRTFDNKYIWVNKPPEAFQSSRWHKAYVLLPPKEWINKHFDPSVSTGRILNDLLQAISRPQTPVQTAFSKAVKQLAKNENWFPDQKKDFSGFDGDDP